MGFYGNPMADAFTGNLQASTNMLASAREADTAKKKRFMDLISTGVTTAAQLKQQQMTNANAAEREAAGNVAAIDLEKSKLDHDLKLEDFKQKSTAQTLENTKMALELAKNTGMSLEAAMAIVTATGKDTNNEGIKNVFSVTKPTETFLPTNNITDLKVKSDSAPQTNNKVSPTPATPQQNLGKVTSRNLVKTYESYVPKPYYDKDGYAVGYGSKRDLEGKPIDPNKEYSPEELQAMFERDVTGSEAEVDRVVKVPLSEMQRATLASFVYNTSLGGGAFASSQLVKKLNSGDYQGAANEMDRWVHSANKSGALVRDQGLVNRRMKEKALFLENPSQTPQYQPIPDGPLQTQQSVSNQPPSTPEQAQALATGNQSLFGPQSAALSYEGFKNQRDLAQQEALADVEKAKAAAAKDQAEANLNNSLLPGGGISTSSPTGAPSTPEEAALAAGWQPKVSFTQQGATPSLLAPRQDIPSELINEKTPEGIPAITNEGAPILAVSSLDGRTQDPVFMPKSAYEDQRKLSINYAKGRDLDNYSKEQEKGRFDDTKEFVTQSSELIHKYADVFESKKFKNDMAYMGRLIKEAPDKGPWGAVAAKLYNEAEMQKVIYKALSDIQDPVEREQVALALNTMNTKALGLFKGAQGGLGAISLPELEMVRSNIMNLYLGKGALKEQMEHNILTINKNVADSAWRVSNYDTFKNAVNKYNSSAYKFGYKGYDYTTTDGYKKVSKAKERVL